MSNRIVSIFWLACLFGVVILVDGQNFTKSGSCPPAAELSYTCDNLCTSDLFCLNDRKCCPTSCGGHVCTKPSSSKYLLQYLISKFNTYFSISLPWTPSSNDVLK